MANTGLFITMVSTGYPSIKKGKEYRVDNPKTANFHAQMGWGKIADSNKPAVRKSADDKEVVEGAKKRATKAKAKEANAKKAGEKTK